MKTLCVSQLSNENLMVTVAENNGKIVIERTYQPDDIKSIVSLLLLTFPPHVHTRQNQHKPNRVG